MNNLFRSPIRVYVLFGVLALFGIAAGSSLSVSLFPTSSRPEIVVSVTYRNMTADDFLRTYGRDLETRLQAISFEGHEVEKVSAIYSRVNVRYRVRYHWGTPAREAEKETAATAQSFSAYFPQDIRETLQVYTAGEGVGFFALMYYSDTRSLDQVYNYLEPIITPLFSRVPDAQFVDLWNPYSKEIQINLNPERMAELQLLPRPLIDTLTNTFHSDSGGYLQVGSDKLEVVMKRQVEKTEDLENILIPTRGKSVLLKEIATVSLSEPKERQRIIRTSGQKSLMVYAQPRPGGNIKKMSEDIIKIVDEIAPSLPKDFHSKALVDPSIFIRSAVENVFYEVCLAAFLAMLVLFAFIGNLKNVATAAIEIPISIVLSFILMRWAGINLNLISLAGLALSAGMNVDGSVVVMENIFRHFELRKNEVLSWADRVSIVTESVKEVRLPLIATTIASLVVFIPLGFTSALTNALLGDLAWAVVFSHGISAFVALILVPTIRLHILRKGLPLEKPAPLEHVLRAIENYYSKSLQVFLTSRKLQTVVIAGSLIALLLSVTLILPRLPKEIIGKPDTDWVVLEMYTSKFSSIHQMDELVAENSSKISEVFGDRMLYTFSESSGPTSAEIMFRLKDKHDMEKAIDEAEKVFASTPDFHYSVSSYNPSELPIPNPPQLRLEVRAADATKIQIAGESLWDLLMQSDLYSNVTGAFSPGRHESVQLDPNWAQISLLDSFGSSIRPWDIADISRLATSGAKVGDIHMRHDIIPVWLRYPDDRVQSLAALESLPIGLQGRILPLKALARPTLKISDPSIYHEDGRELGQIDAKVRHEDLPRSAEIFKTISAQIEKWKVAHAADGVTVQYNDGQEELNDALGQLRWAVGLSILLIFVTMVLQFGDLPSALLILIPIPLGFIGVLLSLWIFHSTLSLNSALGTILLNGIVVGNSIILVDFYRREIARGLGPLEAALSSSRTRLRPILMTSLTTGLGMLPIAFGLGEGGKILQPLGLAVVGGLACSLLLTLFLVPLLQTWYWTWRIRPSRGTPISLFILGFFVTGVVLSRTSLAAETTTVKTRINSDGAVTTNFDSAAIFHEWMHRHVHDYPLVIQKLEVLRGSKARQTSARLRLLPSITLKAERDLVINPPSDSQSYSGTASLNLYRFGADAAEIDRQDANDGINIATLDQAKQTAEQDVSDLYFLDLDTRLRRKVLLDMNAQDEALEKIGAERFQKGLLAQEERDKLEVDVINRHSQMESLEQNARDIEARRATLNITESLVTWPWLNSLSQKKFEELSRREIDLTLHPDFRSAEFFRIRAIAEKDQAWAGMLPSIDAAANYQSGETLSSTALTGNGPSWTNSIFLTIPLFSGYQTYASYKESVASQTVAEISRENTRLRLRDQWKSRVAQYHQWMESLKLRQHGSEISSRIFNSSLRRFRAGHESVNDLALDQGRSRDAELALLDAELAYHRAVLALLQAAGEIWSE